MAVNFKKAAAGKKTKLAEKTLDKSRFQGEGPLAEKYQEGLLYNIPLSAIAADPGQPRKSFDPDKLAELTVSIRGKGVLQPVIIRENDNKDIDAEFLLIAGERRFRASRDAGLENIPAIFSKGDPEEIALVENLQRDDLKPVEEAEAYQKIIDKRQYTQQQLSDIVGKARNTISELLTLNSLPDEIKAECRSSDTPKNVLLEIAKRKDPEEMKYLFEKVKKEKLTVAKIRQLTRPKPTRKVRDPGARALEKIIETKRLVLKLERTPLAEHERNNLLKEAEDLLAWIRKLGS